MFHRPACLLVVACIFGALSTVTVPAQEKKDHPAEILAPKNGTKVGQFEEIEGKLNVKDGWPTVLVQPLVAGQPWYVQGFVEEVEQGKFKAKAQFGDENTKAGIEFKVVIIVSKNKPEAQKI